MLTEIAGEEVAAALDACAEAVLWEAGVERPPVDALLVARRLGLLVARDHTMSQRARFVRLAGPRGGDQAQGTIVVGAAQRPERLHWAIAHEIGECVAHRVFDTLAVAADAARPGSREQVANCLASRLLLPAAWFLHDGRAVDWDLLALKQRYRTASHELIARRMLEMRPPVVVTLCDQGRVRWRRSSTGDRPPRMLPAELAVWRQSHQSGRPARTELDAGGAGAESVCAWPVHEPGWKREIVRTALCEW